MQVVLRDLTWGGGTKWSTGGASKRAVGGGDVSPLYIKRGPAVQLLKIIHTSLNLVYIKRDHINRPKCHIIFSMHLVYRRTSAYSVFYFYFYFYYYNYHTN